MLLLWGKGGGFTPANINFTSGMWIDPSDISTGYQDSGATTPQTASGQPTGKRLDKSGKGVHLAQSTSTTRPIYTVTAGVGTDVFDGVDDNLQSVIAPGFATSMDVFVAINRSSGVNAVLCSQASGSGVFLGAIQSGNVTSTTSASAGFSLLVNGSSIADTRDTLHTSLPSGSWGVVEYQGINISAWTGIGLNNFGPGWFFPGAYGGVIVCPAQTTAVRAQIRHWLGAKVGLSL